MINGVNRAVPRLRSAERRTIRNRGQSIFRWSISGWKLTGNSFQCDLVVLCAGYDESCILHFFRNALRLLRVNIFCVCGKAEWNAAKL